MTGDDTTTIWIVKSKLNDGSEVFAVEIEGQIFDCISEDHAQDMADGFAELVEKNTNISALVRRA